jgi:hypothetical protein
MLCGLVGRYQVPEDGGSMFLWNVGIYPQLHTSSQPRISTSTSTTFVGTAGLQAEV